MVRPIALWPVVLLVSCGMFGGQSREDLTRIVREFNDDLHWGRKATLSNYMMPAAHKRLRAQMEAAGEDLEILDYEISAIEVSPKRDRAVVQVDMSWANRREGLVQKTVVAQHWESKGNNWLVSKQVRVRGVPFPFADEPAKAPSPPPPEAKP